MKKILSYLIGLFFVVGGFSACEEDEIEPTTIALYGFSVDGFKASFQNFSGYFEEYVWDFGDGETSNGITPSHVYAARGEYVVSLTGRTGEVSDVFTDTVRITGPTIKIDGNFSDWDYVAYAAQNEDGEGGTLRAVKAYSSDSHLFFYIEGTASMGWNPLQMFFDTDNDSSTGNDAKDMYPAGSGIDYLYQGMYNYWGNFSKHEGAVDEWNFAFISDYTVFIDDYSKVTEGNSKIIEFSIKKDNFGPLKSAINYGFRDVDNDSWTIIGEIPITGTPTSKLLTLDLTN